MSAEANVVITGVGVVCGFGRGMERLAEGLRQHRSAVRPLRAFDAGGLPIHLAVEVPFEVAELPALPDDRKAALAVMAALDACEGVDMRGAGVFLGTGLSSVTPREIIEDAAPYLRDGRLDRDAICADHATDRVAPGRHLPERATGAVAAAIGANGPRSTSFSACAAGALAIATGLEAIRRGELERALVGGHDAMIHPLGALSFIVLGALGSAECRPFDRHRDGFVIGEGAAMLVLEREDTALARGARPLARLLGAGSSVDAHNVTAPHPEGRGAYLSMRRALADAGLGSVDHVNAHGTGTPLGDAVEARAIRELLGSATPVSSIKGAVGHNIAAAGAVEAAACVAALAGGWSPGTWGLQDPEDLGVLVQREPREDQPSTILSNSFGFGGQNCSLVFGRYP